MGQVLVLERLLTMINNRILGKKEPTEKKSRRKDKEGVGEEEEVEKMESMVLDGEEEENKQG